MRVLVASLALALSACAVVAQTVTVTPAPDSVVPGKSKAARPGKVAVDDGVPECMRLWDKGTHMSRQQWAVTCRRIQSRLENLKIENLELTAPGLRKKGVKGKESSLAQPRT